MPTNYALRTPLFAKAQSSGANTQSAKLLIIVNSVTVYTIVKPAEPNVDVIFEVAELLRDYLTVGFTFYPQKISFVTNIQFFNQPNAGGTAQGSPVNTISGDGYEAYTEFTDGANDAMPFGDQVRPAWLLAPIQPNLPSTLNDDYVVYYPVGKGACLAWIDYSGNVSLACFSATDTTITPTGGVPLTIVRIDCTKYGTGHRVSFINKYGLMQDLYFYLKEVKSISRSNENYRANILQANATYAEVKPSNKLLNTKAKQTRTLSSGYYPQGANEYFEQLLLSENVWLTRYRKNAPTSGETIPVILKTSSFTYKTSVNDGLVEYTMDFEDAFDYINNVR